MLAEHFAESQQDLHLCASRLQSNAPTSDRIEPPLQRNLRMAHDKRYVAQKRQRRRRKAVKAKMKLYEQGKLSYDKLPMLGRTFHSRKQRALKRAE
jgi:hypothetical protein